MDNKEKEINILESQVRQIFASVVWTHKIQEKQADIYREKYERINKYKLIIGAIISSGLIAIILRDDLYIKIITAIISFVNIYCNGYLKEKDFISLAEDHKNNALKYLKIRDELISLLVDINIKKIQTDEIRDKRNIILDELHKNYNETHDASSNAVKKASEALKEKEDNTFSDREIDSYLPKYLRKGI